LTLWFPARGGAVDTYRNRGISRRG